MGRFDHELLLSLRSNFEPLVKIILIKTVVSRANAAFIRM